MALQGRERRKKRKRFTLLLDSSITTKFASYPKDSGSQVRGCTYKFVRNDRSENCILKEFLWKCKVLSRCRKSEKEGEREREHFVQGLLLNHLVDLSLQDVIIFVEHNILESYLINLIYQVISIRKQMLMQNNICMNTIKEMELKYHTTFWIFSSFCISYFS